MQLLLTQILNLDGVLVGDYRDLGEQLILEAEADKDWAICPRCEQMSRNIHQSHFRLAHDLSISNRQVLLKFNRRQFKCHTRQKPFSEALDFVGDRPHYTSRHPQLPTNTVSILNLSLKTKNVSELLTPQRSGSSGLLCCDTSILNLLSSWISNFFKWPFVFEPPLNYLK